MKYQMQLLLNTWKHVKMTGIETMMNREGDRKN